jgi:hypothetical protein
MNGLCLLCHLRAHAVCVCVVAICQAKDPKEASKDGWWWAAGRHTGSAVVHTTPQYNAVEYSASIQWRIYRGLGGSSPLMT